MSRLSRPGPAVPAFLFLAAVAPATAAPAAPRGTARLKAAALAGDWKQVQALGPEALPGLARLYSASSSTSERATIASVFYNLGVESQEAKRALMADVHTPDQALRLQVQWALGRVSSDPDVIDALLENMRHDPVPLFRDKAACALAHDQIHLSPAQKTRLLEGLVDALGEEEPQVRRVAALALRILTGQSKGFDPAGAPAARSAAVGEWKRWLADYRANQ